jgi:hypothetical protein
MSDCEKCGTKTIMGYCPKCVWQETGDEFLVIACDHRSTPDRTWTRSFLDAAKFIADSAVSRLDYNTAKVYNIYGGHASNPLYVNSCGTGKDMPES